MARAVLILALTLPLLSCANLDTMGMKPAEISATAFVAKDTHGKVLASALMFQTKNLVAGAEYAATWRVKKGLASEVDDDLFEADPAALSVTPAVKWIKFVDGSEVGTLDSARPKGSL